MFYIDPVRNARIIYDKLTCLDKQTKYDYSHRCVKLYRLY
jgi:hypothetical protein